MGTKRRFRTFSHPVDTAGQEGCAHDLPFETSCCKQIAEPHGPSTFAAPGPRSTTRTDAFDPRGRVDTVAVAGSSGVAARQKVRRPRGKGGFIVGSGDFQASRRFDGIRQPLTLKRFLQPDGSERPEGTM